MKCYRCNTWPCTCKDGQTIIHGDCREVLPRLGTFDLLLTDPPYGIGEANGKNKSRGYLAQPRDYGTKSWDDEIQQEPIDLAVGMAKWACVFGGNYYRVTPSPCWLVWDKENGDTDFADCELAWTNFKQAARLKRHQWNGMLRKNREERYHPTQKPLDVVRWAMGFVDADTVLDPFLGSGTTLRACKDLGRRGTGIEIEEKYCEIAANRLRQEVLF